MKIGAKRAVMAAVVVVVMVGLAWWSLTAVSEQEHPLDPSALIEQTTLTGFRQVVVASQDQPADLISYAIFTGPKTAANPEVRIASRADAFNEGATIPAKWKGALEGISNARLNGECWIDVLRFLPDRLPDEQLKSWGVEEGEMADARAGKLDIAYVQIVCGRAQH